MAANQEQAKKAESKQEKPAPQKTKTNEAAFEQKGISCPSCGAVNPEEAVFCSECGAGLAPQYFCPNCGAQTSPGADICPACKTWLLEGQCKFCYAQLDPEMAFCPECGNPKDGVPCPHCGVLSIFDFCPGCGKALTEGAQKALELANTDPDAKAVVDAAVQSVSIEAELAELEKVLSDESAIESAPVVAPPLRKKSTFFAERMDLISDSNKSREAFVQRQEQDRKSAEAEAKRQQEAAQKAKIRAAQERKEALEKEKANNIAALREAQKKLAAKTFLSHQEARRWHIANMPRDAAGWLCNYTNTVHTDGPNGCDQPGLGGRPYFADEGGKSYREI